MPPDFEDHVRDITYDTIKRLLRERRFDVLADLVVNLTGTSVVSMRYIS